MRAAACNREVELLDTVPADVDALARLDINRIASECGQSLPPAFAEKISRFKGAVDLSEIFMIVDAGGRDIWLTGTVTDEDSLKIALGEPSAKDSDGFTAYRSANSLKAYTRNRQVWIAAGSSMSSPAAMVKKATDPDGDGSILKVPGVGDFLRRRQMLAGLAVAGKNFTDQWQCIEMDIDNNALIFDHFRVNDNGMVAPTAGLEPINTRFLNYAPKPAALLMAAGIDRDNVDWDAIGKAVGMIGGFTYYGFYEAILPYLKDIDGTISVVAAPTGGNLLTDLDEGAVRFIIMAQMPAAAADKAMQTVSSYVGKLGLPVSKAADGSLSVGFGSYRFHAAYIDGCLAISNFMPSKSTPEGPLVDMIKGKLGAAVLTIDRSTLEEFIPSAVYGITVAAEAGNTHNMVTLRLTECGDSPILPTLIRTFSKIAE